MINVVKGLIIGIANLVPGISGATMAVILGIYEELIASISKFAKFRFSRKDFLLIVTVSIGIAIAIFIGSTGMNFFLGKFPALAYSVFFGLVLGSIPKLYKGVKKFRSFYFALGVFLMVGLELTARTVRFSGMYIVLSGLIAACAMVLPGLSGSLMLLIFGIYDDVVGAVAKMELSIVVPFGVGVVAGIMLMAFVMDWLSEKFPQQTRNFTFGLIVASLLKIEPFTKESLNFARLIIILSMIVIVTYVSFEFSRKSRTSAR